MKSNANAPINLTPRTQGGTKAVVYNKNMNQKVCMDLSKTQLYKDQVIQVNFDGKTRYAFVKEIQHHPVNQSVVHVDLFMPDESYTDVQTLLPVNFINQDQSEGLKRGGFLYITSRSLPVSMRMDSIVPYLNVSVAGMNGGDNVRSCNIPMPSGVTNLRPDLTIATLIGSKGGQ